jgi:hypothetical protein
MAGSFFSKKSCVMAEIVPKFLVTFLIGAFLLLVLSFTIYRRSYYYQKAQAEAAGSDQKPGILSRVITVGFLLVMVTFVVLFDRWVSPDGGFGFYLGLNFLLVSLLSLYDALFIDWFMLVLWRPAVLNLPPGEPTRERMKQHIKLQFTKGWIFKGLIFVLGAGIAVLIG